MAAEILACVAFVDDQVGRLLNGLEAAGHLEDTAVVLTGDTGAHIGEKDCIQKWHLWNESTRVPLVIHVPGAAGNGRACDHPVAHIDIYPTLVDLCGLPRAPHANRAKPMAGNSLRPLIDDPSGATWHGPDAAIMAVKDRDREQPHLSIRTRRHRYTRCDNGEEELYDLEHDPHEWTNLANDNAYAERKASLRHRLEQLRGDAT
jgi:arylsulfatase A-like enzyme